MRKLAYDAKDVGSFAKKVQETTRAASQNAQD
ncbi:unnamed protein product, partial [Tilletia controversa]